MAVAGVSPPPATGPTLGFDDYSLYSNLSDDELIQLAIKRSLSDVHNSVSPFETRSTPDVQDRPSTPVRQPSHNSHNPPANPPESRRKCDGADVSHFVTGNGKRMVAYRRVDGSLQYSMEPEEELDPIVKAILNGDVTTVREIAKLQGKNLLLPNKLGWIPLHEAAFSGQDQCVRVLLGAQPGMINKRTQKDQTALLLAVGKNQVACAATLLEQGADPDIANTDRETALYKACEKENAEIVAMLLNHGATVNRRCIQGWTALHEAVCRNQLEICEMLVKAGAKLSSANIYGITPLFVAAQSGRTEALRFLLKHGADINSQASDGATALYEAAKNGHDEIVELLLSQNADANRPGKNGFLPIHISAQRGTDAIVSMLAQATSKARVRRSGISPLHLAVEYNRNEVLEVLIKDGFDVNAMLSEERSKMYEDRRSTALYFAVINSNLDATAMLLEAGANPNLDTFNPLLVAVRQGCIEAVTLLVEHGANVNAYVPTHPTSFPATVMFCMKYLSMLKYLMDNGGDALSCFSCTYGNNPHPPIKIRRSERDELRHGLSAGNDTSEPHNTTVQFCEMISTPSICRWAGPIIDVLLDYVGDIKLCSRLLEHLDSYPDWNVIKEKATPPRTLMQLCRLKIRQQLGVPRLRSIDTLPFPRRLIKFLKHEENSEEIEGFGNLLNF